MNFLLRSLNNEAHNHLCFLDGTRGVTPSSSGQPDSSSGSKKDGPKKDGNQAAPDGTLRIQKWWSKCRLFQESGKYRCNEHKLFEGEKALLVRMRAGVRCWF
ncbi:unnamed protein product [Trifolium pratense]|uniref:Uncharacterized protein n=1 Tax=Trifolium pratense TaxID=57577 RepID=A0ACB0IVJ8_TRIPR|nr:unnamed protein product [Trifolium pratense]